MSLQTLREEPSSDPGEASRPGKPGLVLVFSTFDPHLIPLEVPEAGLEVGRELLQRVHLVDSWVSRRHATIERRGDVVRVSDLGSTNGVFVQGERLAAGATVEVKPPGVIRLGRTLLLVVADVSRYFEAQTRAMVQGEMVVGPTLHTVHGQVRALAQGGQGLFLRGESGVGKELAARLFHEAGPRSQGPLVTVNCATIPRSLAERLLFGSVRGAYSGATDAPGYLQAAHGGTLFLDEVAELEPEVQAKLLRVLETREVLPLGGTRPQRVELGVCAASHRDLRAQVAAGAFREDLYYRLGRPEVVVPPLRERPGDIAFLVARTARAAGLVAEPSLVEACLRRPWPGNVRELCAEVRAAAALGLAARRPGVGVEHLARQAGERIVAGAAVSGAAADAAADGAAGPEPTEALVRAASETLGMARKTVLKLFPAGVLVAVGERGRGQDATACEGLLRAAAAEALQEQLVAGRFNQSLVAAALGTSRSTLLRLMSELQFPRAADLDPARIALAVEQAGGDLDAAASSLRVSRDALQKRLSQLSPGRP